MLHFFADKEDLAKIIIETIPEMINVTSRGYTTPLIYAAAKNSNFKSKKCDAENIFQKYCSFIFVCVNKVVMA